MQFELICIHAQVQWNYCLWWSIWWERLSILKCDRNSLWFTVFLIKLFEGEMVEAGWKLDQDIAEVDICHNSILDMKIQNY